MAVMSRAAAESATAPRVRTYNQFTLHRKYRPKYKLPGLLFSLLQLYYSCRVSTTADPIKWPACTMLLSF